MFNAKVTSKGQVTIPIEVRKKKKGNFMKKFVLTVLIACIALLCACQHESDNMNNSDGLSSDHSETGHINNTDNMQTDSGADDDNLQNIRIINKDEDTIHTRFNPPAGFERIGAVESSFAQYLTNLPLKPFGSKVKYYNGGIKPDNVYDAVIDIDVGNRDLQQCADAIMRLRAEYLYGKELYKEINFNFANGFNAGYSKWMDGYRIIVDGNDSHWVKRTEYSDDYKSFRNYMDMVFAYANTESLSRDLEKVRIENMQIGDIFMKGSLPGHCVIVVDMAENKKSGEKLFMIAQSYMPAQDIHILKNMNNKNISPWYSINFGNTLRTPEWKFYSNQLMRFKE